LVNFRHPVRWHRTCKIRLVALRFQEARGIQGMQLKAKKEGIVGKAGFPGRHPHNGEEVHQRRLTREQAGG